MPAAQGGLQPLDQAMATVPSLATSLLTRYLERIDCRCYISELQPNLQTLQLLHLQHSLHIPFENLSMVHPEAVQQFPAISVKLDDIIQKLVFSQRGGYCFEMNTLFASVLKTLGFNVYIGRAIRVFPFITCDEEQGEHVPHREFHGHCNVHVLMPDGSRHIADVAFGGGSGLVEPLLVPDIYKGDHQAFSPGPSSSGKLANIYKHRVRPGVRGLSRALTPLDLRTAPHLCGWYLQHWLNNGWRDQYFFGVAEALSQDCVAASAFTAEDPRSPFHGILIVSILTDTGPLVLRNNTLKRYKDGGLVVIELDSTEARDEVLQTDFKISFAAPAL